MITFRRSSKRQKSGQIRQMQAKTWSNTWKKLGKSKKIRPLCRKDTIPSKGTFWNSTWTSTPETWFNLKRKTSWRSAESRKRSTLTQKRKMSNRSKMTKCNNSKKFSSILSAVITTTIASSLKITRRVLWVDAVCVDVLLGITFFRIAQTNRETAKLQGNKVNNLRT